MHVEMENVIKKLEQYIKDDEVTYEFDDAIEELKQLDLGLSSVESLLGFYGKTSIYRLWYAGRDCTLYGAVLSARI